MFRKRFKSTWLIDPARVDERHEQAGRQCQSEAAGTDRVAPGG